MTPLYLFTVFSASLLGSLHCAGMCGGMVGFASASLNRKRRVAGQVSYHLGRLAAYLCLGVTAGAFGLGLNTAAARGGLGSVAALGAGALMILWAVAKLAPSTWLPQRWLSTLLPARWGCGFSRAFTWSNQLPAGLRASVLGLATGLLPCGWLYAFVLAAVGTGHLGAGAALLFAFWLGTLPALVGVGSLAQLLGARARRVLPALSACTLLLIGVGSVWGRYDVSARVLEGLPNAWSNSAELPPCHRH